MKTTKCPVREKKGQEKRKKRGGEKAKRKRQDCCVTLKPKNLTLRFHRHKNVPSLYDFPFQLKSVSRHRDPVEHHQL